MNEELKNQLTQFLEKALDVVNKGIDTAGEQIPALLQEIVYWQIGKNSFALLIAFVFCFTAFVFGLKLIKYSKCSHDADEETSGIILITVSIIISFMTFAITGINIVQALVAPRLVILEYLKGLLCGMN